MDISTLSWLFLQVDICAVVLATPAEDKPALVDAILESGLNQDDLRQTLDRLLKRVQLGMSEYAKVAAAYARMPSVPIALLRAFKVIPVRTIQSLLVPRRPL
jgi:hypothetical protein